MKFCEFVPFSATLTTVSAKFILEM